MGIESTRVITVLQPDPGGNGNTLTMAECRCSDGPQCSYHRVMGQPTQAQDYACAPRVLTDELLQFLPQKRATGRKLTGIRTIAGWQTFHRVGDAGADQRSPVGIRLRCQACAMQRCKKKGAAGITGKGSAGSVGPMHPRREADYEQPGPAIAPGCHWRGMIIGVRIRNLMSQCQQTRTLLTTVQIHPNSHQPDVCASASGLVPMTP